MKCVLSAIESKCHFVFFSMLTSLVMSVSGSVALADHPAVDSWRAELRGGPIANAWVPYRYAKNRPRYVGGWIASKIEPTSQEAMSWREHKAAGSYRQHAPGYVKTYYYPKPWEVLPIEPRPKQPGMPELVPAESMEITP
jgi:hypothetical protein